MDTIVCMGASIGNALGLEKAGDKRRVAAVIGDSTFFHSGITGLLNVVYNRGASTIVVLDNRTTAMTGHQDHPGTGKTLMGEETKALSVEQAAAAWASNASAWSTPTISGPSKPPSGRTRHPRAQRRRRQTPLHHRRPHQPRPPVQSNRCLPRLPRLPETRLPRPRIGR